MEKKWKVQFLNIFFLKPFLTGPMILSLGSFNSSITNFSSCFRVYKDLIGNWSVVDGCHQNYFNVYALLDWYNISMSSNNVVAVSGQWLILRTCRSQHQNWDCDQWRPLTTLLHSATTQHYWALPGLTWSHPTPPDTAGYSPVCRCKHNYKYWPLN